MITQKFNLCDSEGTAEVTVETNLTPIQLQEAWENYYWSLDYENNSVFCEKFSIGSVFINRVEEDSTASKIVPC